MPTPRVPRSPGAAASCTSSCSEGPDDLDRGCRAETRTNPHPLRPVAARRAGWCARPSRFGPAAHPPPAPARTAPQRRERGGPADRGRCPTSRHPCGDQLPATGALSWIDTGERSGERDRSGGHTGARRRVARHVERADRCSPRIRIRERTPRTRLASPRRDAGFTSSSTETPSADAASSRSSPSYCTGIVTSPVLGGRVASTSVAASVCASSVAETRSGSNARAPCELRGRARRRRAALPTRGSGASPRRGRPPRRAERGSDAVRMRISRPAPVASSGARERGDRDARVLQHPLGLGGHRH